MGGVTITYGRSEDALPGYRGFMAELIQKQNAHSICDIGGGANPVLDLDYIQQNRLNYCMLDVSQEELDKAPEGYDKVLADIASPEFSSKLKFDMVVSRSVAEHMKDGSTFHKNILTMLADNGMAVHLFPTLYSPPFLVNCLLPESVADLMLSVLRPRDRYQHAKFPAYYSWCRGPTRGQIQRFEELGYDVVKYRGFFGHEYYKRVKWLQRLHSCLTDYLLRKPNPLFTSYACVVLQKPR